MPHRTLFVSSAVLLCLRVAAFAQPALPPEIVGVESPLTDAQSQKIDQFIRPRVERLLNSEANEEVVEAKNELLGPFDRGGTTFFLRGYSSNLTGALTALKALDEIRRVEVRLNVMILASRLIDPGAIRVIELGLGDPSAGPRYWAAVAAGRLGPNLDLNSRRTLLRALSDALRDEQSQPVVVKLLLALGQLDIPEAVAQLMGALNDRVDVHASNPELSTDAEYQAILPPYISLVRAAERPAFGQDTLREMVLVGFRYFVLSAQHVNNQDLGHAVRQDYQNMLELMNNLLLQAAPKLHKNANLPADANQAIKARNWMVVNVRVQEWKKLLLHEPFSFKPQELAIGTEE